MLDRADQGVLDAPQLAPGQPGAGRDEVLGVVDRGKERAHPFAVAPELERLNTRPTGPTRRHAHQVLATTEVVQQGRGADPTLPRDRTQTDPARSVARQQEEHGADHRIGAALGLDQAWHRSMSADQAQAWLGTSTAGAHARLAAISGSAGTSLSAV